MGYNQNSHSGTYVMSSKPKGTSFLQVGHHQGLFPYFWFFLKLGAHRLTHRLGGLSPQPGQEGCRERWSQRHRRLVSRDRVLNNKGSSVPRGALISTLADLILTPLHLTLGFKGLASGSFVTSTEAFLQRREDFSA